MNTHVFTGKTPRILSIFAALALSLVFAYGCASSSNDPKARVFADHLDTQYNVAHGMNSSGTFDELTFNLLDSNSELQGLFNLTTGPETCEYTNAGVTVSILMADCDSIKYVSHDGSGVLFACLHGNDKPQYICNITDEYWDKITAFTAKWQSHAKFVRESK